MFDQQTVDKTKSTPRRSDDKQEPNDRARERAVRGFIDALLQEPDDPAICRGID